MVATILIIFQNKLTNLASLVQFKCMLMFCLENWGLGFLPIPSPFFLRHWVPGYNIIKVFNGFHL